MANTLALLAAEKPSVGFVCFLGVMVVFVGLACIIGVISLMNTSVSRAKDTKEKQEAKATAQIPVPQASATQIENRGEIIAAVCAAVAEENGTDVSAIRVISFKKIN